MKKIISFTLALMLCLPVMSITAFAQSVSINISQNSAVDTFDENPFGIDLTGDKCAVLGGIGANLVKNGSFEDKDNGWNFEATDCILGNTDSIAEANPTYDIVKSQGTCTIKNHGYGEDDAMGFCEGERYTFTCLVKNIDFEGEILLQLASKGNANNLVQLSTDAVSKKCWTTIKADITAMASENGELALIFNGNGSLEIDNVSLMPKSAYSSSTNEWKYAKLRSDTMQALKMLNPSFIMFSVDGASWINSIGEQSQRSGDGEFGYHEYLCLCNELGADAIPTIDTNAIDEGGNPLDNYIQGVLDLLEYANAGSISSYFGALRAGNGNEDGFDVEYLYLKGKGSSLTAIEDAVEQRYKKITVLTDDDVQSVCNVTEYGKGISKSNMGCALLSAKEMLGKKAGFIAYKNAIGIDEDIADEPHMIIVGKDGLSLSPEYYTQLLLSGNFGEREIPLSQINERITQTARLDAARRILYVYFVNEGASKSVGINLDGFDKISTISTQCLSSGYKSTANIPKKQRLAPEADELEANGEGLTVSLEANSLTVLRIAYGGNTGQNLYQLPQELDLSTRLYVPVAVRVIIAALCISIPIGAVLGFFMYKRLASRKRKVMRDE